MYIKNNIKRIRYIYQEKYIKNKIYIEKKYLERKIQRKRDIWNKILIEKDI